MLQKKRWVFWNVSLLYYIRLHDAGYDTAGFTPSHIFAPEDSTRNVGPSWMILTSVCVAVEFGSRDLPPSQMLAELAHLHEARQSARF